MLSLVMSCVVCQSKQFGLELKIGSRPLSTQYVGDRLAESEFFPINLAICSNCSTLQLNPVPNAADLIPKNFSFNSNEPENHLDQIVSDLISIFDISVFENICGISYKDSSLLERFKKIANSSTYILNKELDLNISEKTAGIESIQNKLSQDNFRIANQLNNNFSLVIARHILEHSNNVGNFLYNLNSLLKDNGFLLLEIPDVTRNLIANEYTMVWEEHSIYLNPEQLRSILQMFGFVCVYSKVIPLPFENSIVVLVKKTNEIERSVLVTNNLLAQIELYFSNYKLVKNEIIEKILRFRKRGFRFGLFGAGHLACAFIHYFSLEDYVDFCFDDTNEKIGNKLPGTRIPIRHSRELVSSNIDICLLSVSIQNEQNVINKLQDFKIQGGEFYSVFKNSPISIFDSEE